ncbi:hypothetical protein [Bradyrhizobium sp. STM 3557]|uniref:hypothetical protein n=1 Tax=Bradyrhizobium sp. STM 3557 TaxID=578920 RepID=UPI00388F4E62
MNDVLIVHLRVVRMRCASAYDRAACWFESAMMRRASAGFVKEIVSSQIVARVEIFVCCRATFENPFH